MVEGRGSKLRRQKTNIKLNQLWGKSHERGGQRRTRSIVRGGRRGCLSGDTGLVVLFIADLHTKYTTLSKTIALEDGDLREKSVELPEPLAGERCDTA